MPETDINSSIASDLDNVMTDYSVDAQETEAAGEQKETTWQMTRWSEWLGYYKKIPELKSAIDTKATWTVGAGFEADEQTTMLLDTIRGNGKDTFNSILKNAIRVKTLAGDSFAEIIRDEEEFLINLKPLDPSTIRVVQNRKGMILRYEQLSKTGQDVERKFKPAEMFHLCRDRVADEMHGVSVIPAVEWIILARNEAMTDWRKMLHRNVIPVNTWFLDTDDKVEIAKFKAKHDAAAAGGENMYIPKGAAEKETGGIAPNATMSPLTWIAQLNDYFFQTVNVPQIIMGNAKEFTDASGKIVYLSYEQSVKAEQLYIEEQVLAQLNLEIQLTFPASLQNEAISDTPNMELEEEPIEEAAQENDTTEEVEGKT